MNLSSKTSKASLTEVIFLRICEGQIPRFLHRVPEVHYCRARLGMGRRRRTEGSRAAERDSPEMFMVLDVSSNLTARKAALLTK